MAHAKRMELRRLRTINLLIVSAGVIGVYVSYWGWPYRLSLVVATWTLPPHFVLATAIAVGRGQRTLCATAMLLTGSGIWVSLAVANPADAVLWQFAGVMLGVALSIVESIMAPAKSSSDDNQDPGAQASRP